MGVNGHAKPAAGFRWGDASDPFDLFAEDGNPFEDAAPRPRVDRNVADALALLELAPMATAQDVRTRYKALAKKYHPDLNGGSKTAEERLKQINEAYSRLIAAGYA
jgi:DnaJ-domain-containing protein 1